MNVGNWHQIESLSMVQLNEKPQECLSSKVLSLNIECREPVTRSARNYKQQQMAMKSLLMKYFASRTKQSAPLEGIKSLEPKYLYQSQCLVSDLLLVHVWLTLRKSLGRKQNRTSLYKRQKQALWLQLELREESQKSTTWHQGLNLGESGKLMAVFVQKIPSVKVSKWDIAFITLYWRSGIDFSFICWSASQSAEFLHQPCLAPHNFTWGLTGSHDWVSGRQHALDVGKTILKTLWIFTV